LPFADAELMNLHLVEISANVAPGAHAVLTIDGAGWHQTGDRPSPEASHVIPSALRPSRTDRRRATPSAGDETSRCLDKVRLCILESSTTLGKPVARVEAAGRIAFRVGNVVNTLEKALSWLASPCPSRNKVMELHLRHPKILKSTRTQICASGGTRIGGKFMSD
jgi:hypothetical protein